MASNVDTLKKGYEDFSNGDIESATEPWADDFVWDGGISEELPGAGVHEGKDEAVEVLQKAVGEWDKFELSVDDFVDGGDTVVVLCSARVEKDGSGEKIPTVHVWRFEDGTPKRIQILTDTLASAKLLGKV